MALPWQQDEDPDAPLKNLVEATQLSNLLDVPQMIRVKDPRGNVVTLYRYDHADPSLGGRCWLFFNEKPSTMRNP